jgi:hypothetical protein
VAFALGVAGAATAARATAPLAAAWAAAPATAADAAVFDGGAGLLPRPGLQALQTEVPPAVQPVHVTKQPVSMPRAALMSAILPGLGEYYAGHHTRALISGTVEAAIWTSYITFKVQEDTRADRAIEYAVGYAGAKEGLDDDYFSAIGQFLRADGPGMWNEFVRRRERDTGESVGREYTGDEAWAWPSQERFLEYRELRKSSLRAGDRASNTLALALVNRVVSVVSVVQAVRSDHKRAAQALGMLRFETRREPEGLAWRLGVRRRF